MIATFQALIVTLVALLPGALYTIAREHRGASWAKADATGRLIRFLGVSAAFHAVFAPITYWGYRELVVTHVLATGSAIAWYWWPVLLGYLALPYALGEVTAASRRWDSTSAWPARSIKRVVSLYTASSPEPRAWDAVFSRSGLTGWVRLRLTDGTWKAGPWSGSYASGYPEERDLYLSNQAELTDTGQFVLDDSGRPRLVGAGLLIQWPEVSYLELLESNDGGSG